MGQNSPMRVLSRRAVAAAAAITMLTGLTGCGDDGGSATPGPDATSVASAPDLGFVITPASYQDPFSGALDTAAQAPALAVLLAKGLGAADKRSGDLSTPAADLGAQLTGLFVTHVYALGTAVTIAYGTSPTSAKTKAALAAVEANSKNFTRQIEALAKEATGDKLAGGRGNSRAVPAADPTPGPTTTPATNPAKADKSGKSGRKPSASPTPTEPPFNLDKYDFAKAWKAHVGLLMDYAFAAKESNDRDKRSARADLDAWRQQAGQYFRAISKGRLSSYAVRTDLGKYVGAVTGAIDALAKKDGDGYIGLREAADQLPDIVARLSAGLASATDRSGSVTDEQTKLRIELTAILIGHTYLTALSYVVAFGNGKTGLVSAGYRRVQVSLDDNSKQLADLVRQLSGPVKEAEFVQGWRIHLRDLENYARALDAGDLPARGVAIEALDAYLGTVSKFLRSLTGGELEPAAVEKRLRAQLAGLIGVVDALHIAFEPNGAS